PEHVRTTMTRLGTVRLTLLAALALPAAARPARASNELRGGVTEIARSIKQLLAGKGEDSVVVGPFTGPANFPASAGPGIQQLLAEELQKLGITVKKRAKFGVKGEYLVTEVPGEEPRDVEESKRPRVLAILLKGTVEDEFGKVVTDFSFKVRGEAAFVNVIGTTVLLAPGDTNEQRDRRLREGLTKPRTYITKSQVRAAADGNTAV